jgi:hypothetical protein
MEEPLNMRASQKPRSLKRTRATHPDYKMNANDDFDPYREMHAESRFAMSCVLMVVVHIDAMVLGIGQVSLDTPEQMANDRWCLRILDHSHIDQLIDSGMTFIEEENRMKVALLRFSRYFAGLGLEIRDHELLYRLRSLTLDALTYTRCSLGKLELIRKRLLHAMEERERLREILAPHRRTIYENDHLSP